MGRGRAYARLIEAAEFLISDMTDPVSAETLRQAMRISKEKLRLLVANLPPEVMAQILAASEKIVGTIREVSHN